MRLPEFDRLPESPPSPRRPDVDDPSPPDVFATELHRASAPPPRRPMPEQPSDPGKPRDVVPRAVAKPAPRKPKHDDPPQNPSAPQQPAEAPRPTAPATATDTAPATATVTDTTTAAATDTVTATATATATATVAAPVKPAVPKATTAAGPSPTDDAPAIEDTITQTPAAEPTPAAASALLASLATATDSAAAAPAATATDKPTAGNPLAAAIDDAVQASVTMTIAPGSGNAGPHGDSSGASQDGAKEKAADALLGMRLGTQVRPLPRGVPRSDGEAINLFAAPRGVLHASGPRANLPTLPIERPEPAEAADPAAQPGHHRADLTVGDGDQKIVVSVMASEHQVRVHARAVSGDETAALKNGAGELRDALKKQGLELAYLGAETMGGRASQERAPQREAPSRTNDEPGLAPVDDEAARPDVRVIA